MALTHARSAPGGNASVGEVAGDELDALVQPGGGQTPPRHRDDMRQVEDRGLGRGTGAQKGDGPGARGPANVQQVPELQRLHGPDDLVGVGGGDVVHRADEGLLVAGFAAHARHAFGGPAGLDDSGQLRPVAEAMRLVLGHGQDALRSVRRQESIQAGRKGVAAAGLFEQPQRDEGVQENGQGAQVALKRAGEFRRRQRRGRQRAEKVQVRRGGQDRRALVAASQGQDVFAL